MSDICPHCNASATGRGSAVVPGERIACASCGKRLLAAEDGLRPASDASVATKVDAVVPQFDDDDAKTRIGYRPNLGRSSATPAPTPYADDQPTEPSGVRADASRDKRDTVRRPPAGPGPGGAQWGGPSANPSAPRHPGALRHTAMPMPAEVEGGYDDAVTGVINARELQRRLQQMRDEQGEQGDEHTAETTPRTPIASAEPPEPEPSGAGAGFVALPGVAKAGLAIAAAALCAAIAIGAFTLWRAAARVAYLSETQPLLTGPGPRGSVDRLGVLERGEQVTSYATVGDYAMVTDAMGRAGYVLRAALSHSRPDVLPDLPFAGCRLTILETTPESCLDRADNQAAACRRFCEDEAVSPDCFDACRARLSECQRGCRGLIPSTAGGPRPQAAPSVAPDGTRPPGAGAAMGRPASWSDPPRSGRAASTQRPVTDAASSTDAGGMPTEARLGTTDDDLRRRKPRKTRKKKKRLRRDGEAAPQEVE